MKSQKGITLVSLTTYVVGLVILVSVISLITAYFYTNTENITENSNNLGEFNKFNLEMVRETKQIGNNIASIELDGTRITFTSGNIYTFQDEGVYKNKVKICTGLTNCKFKKVMQEEKEIVAVLFEMPNFAKTVEYVMQSSKTETNANIEETYTQVSIKQYVQDGLQIHYDAINNTGDGHSSTTTTWRDLSPNHKDGELKGFSYNNTSGWGDKYLRLNGTSDWIKLSNILKNTDQFTIEYVYNHKSNAESEYIWGTEADQFGLKSSGNSSYTFYYSNEESGQVLPNSLINKNSVIQNTIKVSGNTLKVYKNGENISSSSIGTIVTTGDFIGIGATGDGNNKTQMDCFSFRIYNRALTDEEIMRNYQIDKERYGIED